MNVSYSDLLTLDDNVTTTNVIQSDPMFVDAAGGDFSLQLGSPCINAGDPASVTDPDGTRQEMGSSTFTIPANTAIVNGTVNTTTWTTGDTVRINGEITIPYDRVVTIQPGVDVVFDQPVEFTVAGKIFAVGTQSDSIRFMQGLSADWGGIRLTGGDTSTTIMHYCRISDGNATSGGAIYASGTNALLSMENSVISDNLASAQGGGLWSGGGANLNLNKCLIYRNEVSSAGGGGGFMANGGDMTFTNCIFDENNAQTTGNSGRSNGDGTVVTLKNCITWLDGTGALSESVGGVINATYSAIAGGYTGTGNVDTDPMFTDAAARDYSFVLGSPCINASDPATGTDGDGTRLEMGFVPFTLPVNTQIVNGTVNTTTWTTGDTVRINGEITIPYDRVVTIQPGVDVVFDQPVEFTVAGKIFAVGTQSDSIRFMQGLSADWGGIRLTGGDTSTTIMHYCRISDGNATSGGAIYASGTNALLSMENSVISDNLASAQGGGLWSGGGANLNLNKCLIYRNEVSSAGGGGGFMANGGDMTFTNCIFDENNAQTTGNSGRSNGDGTVVTLKNCITWLDGTGALSVSIGGVINATYSCIAGGYSGVGNVGLDPMFTDAAARDYSFVLGSPCINASDPATGTDGDGTRLEMGFVPFTIPINTVIVNGPIYPITWFTGDTIRINGSVVVYPDTTLTIQPGVDVVFDQDVRFRVMGGLEAVGTETDSIRFRKGLAASWGGIRISGLDTSTIHYTRISDGNAAGEITAGAGTEDGGGIYVNGTNPRVGIAHSVIRNNSAGDDGGGVMIVGPANVTMDSCTVRENYAESSGAGIYCYGPVTAPSLAVRSCLITGNSTGINGGGAMRLYDAANVVVDRCVVYGNTDAHDYTIEIGGSAGAAGVNLAINNSIVWGNSTTEIYNGETPYGTVNVNYSDIQGDLSANVTYTAFTNINPMFTDAAAGDFSLQLGSPCINSGDPASGTDGDGTRIEMGLEPFTLPPNTYIVNGPIGPTTWLSGDTIRVNGPVFVYPGTTLTVQPDVRVLFDQDVPFFIDGGKLQAVGTETDSIWFMGGLVSDWYGLRISGGDTSTIAYASFRDGNARGATDPWPLGGALFIDETGTRVRVSHSVFQGNMSDHDGGAAYVRNGATGYFNDCLFTQNSALWGAGLSFASATVDLERCLFTENTSSSSIASGILAYEAGALNVRTCTFTGNTSAAINFYTGTTTGDVTGCILWGNGASDVLNAESSVNLSYSNVMTALPGGITPTNNLSTDPLFADSASGDFSLVLGSPCINRGDPAETDPDGSRSDMGAFPYTIPAGTVITSGELTGNTTWTTSANVRINGDLIVPVGVTLSIEPDVQVLFDQDARIIVNGELDALGTVSDSISFDLGVAPQWQGIYITGAEGGTDEFNYTRISHVSAPSQSGGALSLDGTDAVVSVTNSKIVNCLALKGSAAYVANGASLTLSNTAIDSCEQVAASLDGGAVAVTGASTANLTDCTLANCQAASGASGGALSTNGTGATMTATRALIYDCSASSGGAVASYEGTTTLTNCTIVDNLADATENGYGIFVSGGTLSLTNSVLWNNNAIGTMSCTYSNTQDGYAGEGNMSVDPQFTDDIADDFTLSATSPCINAGNPASGTDSDGTRVDMGAYYHDLAGGLNIVSGTIPSTTWTSTASPYHVNGPLTVATGNTLVLEPGVTVMFDNEVPFNVSGSLQVLGVEGDSVYIENGAGDKGGNPYWQGIRITGNDSSTIRYAKITDGYASGTRLVASGPEDGGAVSISGGRLGIAHSVFTNNYAEDDGGALEVSNGAVVTIDTCIITGNSAGSSGGAISANGIGDWPIVKIAGCEISNNTTMDDGGSVAQIWDAAEVTFDRCTAYGNTSGAAQTVYVDGSAGASGVTLTVRNSIFWNNDATTIANLNATPATVTVAYSDVSTVDANVTTDNALQTDPLFTDAATGDYSLRVVSPCINTGDPASSPDPDSSRADMGIRYFHSAAALDSNSVKAASFVPLTVSGSIFQTDTVTLAFLTDSSKIDSVALETHALAGGANATGSATMSGDTVFVTFGSDDAAYVDNSTIAVVKFLPRSISGDTLLHDITWIPYPNTSIGDASIIPAQNGKILVTPLYGDVTLSSIITSDDAVWALQKTVGSREVVEKLADVTDNGRVSAFDAAMILYKIVNPAFIFPVEGGVLPRPAFSAPVALSFEQDGDAFVLRTDVPEAIDGLSMTLRLADGNEAVVTSPELIASNQTGDRLDIALARIQKNSDVLLRIEGLEGTPFVVSAEANEGLVPTMVFTRPIEFALYQNVPNPFNPITSITYGVTERGHVNLTIYNALGQAVRTLVDREMPMGVHQIVWDGKDNVGRAAGSGIYIYRLVSPEGRLVKKMVMVR